ncbi:butyrophilin subfamily 1 member A1-like isoform X2 [Scyliorhinus torazame]|uniref:butyrophilin subfamily 1 member A1-like isoform X2 n=1 Tax=Scyliorhinus torazame TaxID=75743 RepID=UPI003B5CFDE9
MMFFRSSLKIKRFPHTVVLLLVILDSAYSKFLVLGPDEPVVAVAGADVLLECQLVPDLSASNMEIRWVKSGLELPVHMYRNGEDDIFAQHKDYRARTQLLKEELTKGTISLRIKNVTRFDEGEYRCLVGNETDSKGTEIRLEVIGLGCEPWIQMKGYHQNGILLVCKSSGWFPKPKIQWISEDGQVLTQAERRSQQDSRGLVNVQSDIVITKQSTNRFKCRVLSEHLDTAQEVTIKISDDIFPAVPDWLVPLLVTLCCLIVGVSVEIYWSLKQHRHIKELERRKSFVELVSVTLDVEAANPQLELSEDLKSLRWTWTQRSLPDTRKRFTHRLCPCALGSEGFTSGRHYWEVEVTGNRVWILGVAAESVERKDRVSLSPETGFWTIERFDDQFNINSSPGSRLPVGQIPGKVGVYLSYESGTVSFYNVDTKSHLQTFAGNKFTEKLYPFFWTWDENNWLRICSGSDWISNRGGALTSQ